MRTKTKRVSLAGSRPTSSTCALRAAAFERLFYALAAVPALLLVQCVGDEPVVSNAPVDGGDGRDAGDSAAPVDANGGGADVGSDVADAVAPIDAGDAGAGDAADGGHAPEAGPGTKQAFVTADVYNGRFDPADGGTGGGGVAAADLRCNEAAAAAFPGRQFSAWLATSGQDAPARLGAGPWYVGTALLGGKTELTTGALGTLLNKTPEGTTLSTSQAAWTGTDEHGAFYAACTDWSTSSSSDSGEIGTVGGTSATWTNAVVRSCDTLNHLYCFEK